MSILIEKDVNLFQSGEFGIIRWRASITRRQSILLTQMFNNVNVHRVGGNRLGSKIYHRTYNPNEYQRYRSNGTIVERWGHDDAELQNGQNKCGQGGNLGSTVWRGQAV